MEKGNMFIEIYPIFSILWVGAALIFAPNSITMFFVLFGIIFLWVNFAYILLQKDKIESQKKEIEYYIKRDQEFPRNTTED